MKRNAVLLAVMVVTISAQLFCQPDEEKITHKFIGKLSLTQEQKKDIDRIHFDMKKQTIELKASVATARLELQQLFKVDIPDKTVIEKKLNEIADLGVQLQMIKINSWFSVNKLLTVEQQKIWKKALEKGLALEQHKMMMRRGNRNSMSPRLEEPMQK
jgi:Spy/CpxP family protein refolding chaperone